jgi:hypothetical protein
MDMKLRYSIAPLFFFVLFAKAEDLSPNAKLNEFTGTVISVDYDSRMLRMSLEGGYNVQFTFDSKTVILNGHDPMKISELSYGDKVTARYAGKDLHAHQIVRNGDPTPASDTAQAANTTTVAASTTTTTAPEASSVALSVTTTTPTP